MSAAAAPILWAPRSGGGDSTELLSTVPLAVAKPIPTPSDTREAELKARIAQLEQDRQLETIAETSETPKEAPVRPFCTQFRVLVSAGILAALLVVVLVPIFTICRDDFCSSQDMMDFIRSATLLPDASFKNNTVEGKALALVMEEYETGVMSFTRESAIQRYALASIVLASPQREFDPRPECTWGEFVVCSMENQVTELQFANFSLAGTIPPDVGLLTSLTRLILENNALTGTIPESIGELSKVVDLHLFNNALTGTIPPALSRLTDLTVLRCGDNDITGTFDPTFLSPSLAWISFFQNNISGTIPESVGTLASLEALILSHNNLTGSLPSSLWTLPQLSHLFLNDNRLTGRFPQTIRNKPLERLEVRDNQLTGELPAWTARVGDLDVGGNNFT